MTTDFDVAIAGYGPVGQALAILLGRRGWKTAVFDRQRELYPLPRACHLDYEAMRILQAMGIADEIDAAITPAREYLLLRGDLSVLSDLPRGWETPTGWEASYHFYQPDVEHIFDAAAKALPGVTVRQGTAVTGVVDDGEVVTVSLDSGERVTARFVIGADGANSLVRECLGIPREDLGFEATWVVNDVELKEGCPPLDVPDTGQVLDPAQPRHMAWLGGRHYRWEFMVLDGVDAGEAVNPERVWAKLSRWVDPGSAVLRRSALYTFRSLVAETFGTGRVLLAGDAAHLMPPFMGQGMVSGLRDAITLSWMLDLVLRDVAPVPFLENYTLSRRPHVTKYIAESVRIGQMVCETDPAKAAERDRILAAQTETPPPFRPPVEAFVVPGPLAGTLAVQPRVWDGERSRMLDDVLGPGFQLLTTDPADVEGLSPEAEETCALVGVRSAVIGVAVGEPTPSFAEEKPRFADWLARAGATWVLVRPDGYVYESGTGRAALEQSLPALRAAIAEGVACSAVREVA